MARTINLLDACPECDRPWTQWPKRPSLSGKCPECRREYHRRYEYSHPEKREEWNERHKRKYPGIHNARYRHRYHAQGLRFSRYGITKDQFEQMYRDQDGTCAICSNDVSESDAYIDHDHKTGRVRGLLCANCNRGVGCFHDDTSIIEKAIAYLDKEQE